MFIFNCLYFVVNIIYIFTKGEEWTFTLFILFARAKRMKQEKHAGCEGIG